MLSQNNNEGTRNRFDLTKGYSPEKKQTLDKNDQKILSKIIDLFTQLNPRFEIQYEKLQNDFRTSKILNNFFWESKQFEYEYKHSQEGINTVFTFFEFCINKNIMAFNPEYGRTSDEPFILTTPDFSRVASLFFVRHKKLSNSGETGDSRYIEEIKKAHPLQIRLGGGNYHWVGEISEQLSKLLDELKEKYSVEHVELSDTELVQHIFDALLERFRNTELNFKYVLERQREKNAFKVNQFQNKQLQSKEFSGNSAVIPDMEMQNRTLILYFREEGWRQMDAFLFCFCYLICKWYVEDSGYSRIFNSVKVVSRKSKQYPKSLHALGLENSDYMDLYGEEFERKTSVGANTVHFTHGTVHGTKYFSPSVLCTAIRNDKFKKQNLNNDFVPLPLYFFPQNNEAPKTEGLEKIPTEDMSKDLYLTLSAMISSIRQLEDKMLSDASILQKFIRSLIG